MDEQKLSFEEAYKKLERAADNIMNEDVPLEKAMECYREGRRYYQMCSRILEEAEQLIEIYDKETDTTKEFSEHE